MDKLEKLISPTSVAVIGASSNPEKLGFQIVRNIKESGFQGAIYPINIKGGSVLSLKMSPSVLDIEDSIDLAVVAIPSAFIIETLEECVAKHIHAVIIISSGFAEIGEAGQKLQDQAASICRENNIALLGPNCLGLINCDNHLNASFASSMPKQGNVALVSQSGAIVSGLIDWSKENGVGFSKIFSIGNKALLEESDLLEYLYQDQSTKVIVLYLEQLSVSDKLTRTLVNNSALKPTIVLFGGKSSFGAEAAASHTGSIVSSYTSISTYLSEAGVILADGFQDLFTYIKVFSKYQNKIGRKIGIVTNAGGPGIATCDIVAKLDLQLAKPSSKTVEILASKLRPEASLHNPIDILGDGTPSDYGLAVSTLVEDPEIDALIVLLTPQSGTNIPEISNILAEIRSDKPILFVYIGGERVSPGVKFLVEAGKLCFSYPDDAARGLAALHQFSKTRGELLIPCSANLTYNESEKFQLLDKYALPVLKYELCENIDEAIDIAERVGFPVVLKTAKTEVTHKSDEGGVILNIKDEETLREAYAKIGSPAILGKMISPRFEIFLGIKKDPKVGSIIAFGTGGIFSEIYNDFSYRVAPVSTDSTLRMIEETKMGKLLKGARGQKPLDLVKLSSVIINTARFANDFINIKEIDFNPIIADDENYYIVDTRIILNEN